MVLGDDKDENDENDEEEEEEEEEEYDEDNPRKWDDPAGWVSFAKGLIVYFIISLLVGLFGASFIYLTTRGSDLDTILPTYDLFYSGKRYKVEKKGASNIVDCNESPTGTFSVFEDNFPYNLIKIKGAPTKEQLKTLTFVERLVNWAAKCVAGCFKTNRGFLKGWLDNFAPEGPLGNHVFQIYIAMPFTIVFLGIGSLFTGWFSAAWTGITSDSKVTIWGGFLLYAWGLFGSLALLITARFLGTMMFYPMSQNWKEVANIMACNVKPLVILFGFFVCGAAYDSLDPVIAGIMGIVYLMLVAWSVWRYLSKQMF
jgi:hypothetical protein